MTTKTENEQIRNVLAYLSTLTPKENEYAVSICATWGFDLLAWKRQAEFRLNYIPETDEVRIAYVKEMLNRIREGGEYRRCPECGHLIRID